MRETKFTPRPWKFNAYDGSITDCTVSENEIATAQIEDWNVLGMGYANAHLIACAPDMYQAICELVEIIKQDAYDLHGTLLFSDEEIAGYEQLLKRARGE